MWKPVQAGRSEVPSFNVTEMSQVQTPLQDASILHQIQSVLKERSCALTHMYTDSLGTYSYKR